MPFGPLKLTPELLEMGLSRIGSFVGQFRDLDVEAKKALVRFIMRAADSGDANHYVKSRLGYLEAHDDDVDRPPPIEGKARVTTSPGGRR